MSRQAFPRIFRLQERVRVQAVRVLVNRHIASPPLALGQQLVQRHDQQQRHDAHQRREHRRLLHRHPLRLGQELLMTSGSVHSLVVKESVNNQWFASRVDHIMGYAASCNPSCVSKQSEAAGRPSTLVTKMRRWGRITERARALQQHRRRKPLGARLRYRFSSVSMDQLDDDERVLSSTLPPQFTAREPFHAVGDDEEDKQVLAREFVKPMMDATFLVNNYTAPALAAAYQDREYTLRLCAELLNAGKIQELREVLKPYQQFSLETTELHRQTALSDAFSQRHLERMRKRLSRLPRQITKAYTHRAAVVIPLCMYDGVPSVLFTVRSLSVGKHKGEVCFPGGMVDADDISIEGTCLREMNEEVGLSPDAVQVLGILRCDWSSVTSITGIAVTPVVGYIGEMSDQSVVINEAEVESLFTVSLEDLVDPNNWIRRPNATPVFTGGPHVVWGLTAYLLDICLTEVLQITPTRQ